MAKTSHFLDLQERFADAPFVVSPAEVLGLPVGYDEYGFVEYRTFRVGDVVVGASQVRYLIIGFTKANKILAEYETPVFGVDSVELRPEGLAQAPQGKELPFEASTHKNGLILLRG